MQIVPGEATVQRISIGGREYDVQHYSGHFSVFAVCKRRCKDGRITESTRAMRSGTSLALAAIAAAQAI